MAVAIDSRIAAPRILGIPEEWFHLALGLVIAPILSLTPFLSLVGWFLASLIHEMGHTAFSWVVGVPAVPALGFTAEAATMHGEQLWILAAGIWAGLAWLAWRIGRPSLRYATLAVVGIAYPLFAFTSLREVMFLLSGHLGELSVGAVFLWRALSGGFSESQVERGLYAVLGWYLVGRNVVLTAGLMTSAPARADYAAHGSFGLENDYLRLAGDLGWSLEGVALLMTAGAVLTAPAVVGAWLWWTSEER
jgi:hypothetical protein